MSRHLSTIRNIGVTAHIDAGKTTTTERLLYFTPCTTRIGNVDDGTTTTDFDEQEQKRGITIYSAAVTCPWREYTINLIDTPGHVDFTAEVERSLRVLDGSVMVFDSKEGVEAQSETVWRQADKYRVARICFLNKMDKIGADFYASLDSIVERLHAKPVAIQLPIGAESTFAGVIDLMRMRAIYYEPTAKATKPRETDIPDELQESACQWRHRLEEAAAELDDSLMEKFIHDQALTAEEMRPALRRGTIENRIQPVLCGSSLRSMGIQPLLDAVCDFLPSPLDMPPVIAHAADKPKKEISLKPEATGPLAALVFKVVAEKPMDLFYIRVYSGRLRANSRVWNPAAKCKENVPRIVRVFAKRREPMSEVSAGDIAAIVGPKKSLTGHTLCDQRNPLLLESIEFPETVISRSIEPSSSRDRDKLAEALSALSRQDPTFRTSINPDTGETLISGMGELHLEVLVTRLIKEMNVDVRVGTPRVSFRETITTSAEGEGRFVRQTGGRGQFAVVKLRVEPTPKDADPGAPWFHSEVRGGAVQQQHIRAVEQGVLDAAGNGSLGGYPVVDFHATILDGREHAVDSSELAFEHAGAIAFSHAIEKANPVLLEPIMKVEVVTPDDYFGSITGDLKSRRANVVNTTVRGRLRVIEAHVPLREMFGYTTDLRSLSQGRAQSAMEPLRYAPVPKHISKEMLGL